MTVEQDKAVGSDIPTGLTFVDPGEAPSTFNVLLYGPPGSGKTTAATSAPGPILVLNGEGSGALSFSRSLGRDIREVRMEDRATLGALVDYARAGADGAKTIVVDTVGAVHRALLEDIGGQNPKIQHYGQVNNDIARLIRFLRDLPFNLILVCHEKIDDQDGDRIVRPLTGGQQLPELLMGEVDVVGYCGVVPETEEHPRRHVAQLVEDRGRRAKDRSGGLGRARDLDLTEWLIVYAETLRPTGAESLPWDEALPELGEGKAA